jgi:hypothetical protein
MINAFGAPIDQADARIIADYLKTNYEMSAVAPSPASSPGAELPTPLPSAISRLISSRRAYPWNFRWWPRPYRFVWHWMGIR